MDIDCLTCKHRALNPDDFPCCKCEDLKKWEPKQEEPMKIKDSGQRTEFETGAVRDIQEGKGRCDLLPLDVVGILYRVKVCEDNRAHAIFGDIYLFTKYGNWRSLADAIAQFVEERNFPSWEDMFLEVAKHFEEGAKKYGEHNWQKGIPVSRYLDSGVRHYLKWLRGDKDEPHDRAFCWNMMCAIWTCINKPELNEYQKGDH